jgi:Cu(I)/Ag(I) efflux system protein CusF
MPGSLEGVTTMKKMMMVLALSAPFAVTAAETSGQKSPQAKSATAQPAAVALARGIGVVKGLDAPSSRIIISHEAIPAVQWPAMVMSFRISKELAKDLKVGQKLEFEFEPRDMDGTITKVKVLP